MTATPEEIAWAAGLFEGEGSISIRPGTASVRLDLGMADEDVVRHFHALVGAGKVYRKHRSARPEWSDIYNWHLDRSVDIRRILTAFLPWLHDRRGARAREALVLLENNKGPRGEWTHCPKGHPLSGDNLYVYARGGRMCRACHNKRMREPNRRWRERQREAVS